MIIDGKKIADKIVNKIKSDVEKLGKKPTLAVIIAGNNPASKIYVKNKAIKAKEAGFNSIVKELDENVSKEELQAVIDELNSNPEVNGILLQLPLPKHLDEKEFLDLIDPKKDVDGFTTYNAGKIIKGEEPYAYPCTPKGIISLLDEYNIDVKGKLALVINRSNIVGKPMACLLLKKDATVILAHSKTKNIKEIAKNADIIISATGHQNFITEDMIKENAVVIDVGIIRGEDGKLKGDVDFYHVQNKASYITPVPKGVGPMTIASLIENTYSLYLIQKG